jgi:membrane-associated phospholipid phosphatase
MNNFLFFNLYSFAHQSFFLDWLVVFSANTFGYIMVFLALVYLVSHTDGVFDYRAPFLQFKNKFTEIAFVFTSSISAWIIATILKYFISSPRPFLFFNDVLSLFTTGGIESFPSGHAMFFSALAMSIYFIHRRMGYLYFAVALIVGLARVASGVHFPVDILAGYVLGILTAIIFKYIFALIFKKRKQNLIT